MAARHDFCCGRCAYILHNIAVPVSVGARAWADTSGCLFCGGPLDWLPFARFSAFTDAEGGTGTHCFEKCTTTIDDPGAPGGYREETIGSLADIRRLERESEQRARNGEGRRLVWRDYSQDRTNRDQHSFMADPTLTPSKTYLNGTPVRIRRGDPVIADHGTVEDASP